MRSAALCGVRALTDSRRVHQPFPAFSSTRLQGRWCWWVRKMSVNGANNEEEKLITEQSLKDPGS